MAYRRRQGMSRASTFKEEMYKPAEEDEDDDNERIMNNKKKLTSSHTFTFTPSSSLASQAIRASASRHDDAHPLPHRSKVFDAYDGSSVKNDPKGFWGVLARKAKAIIDDDHNLSHQFQTGTHRSRFQMPEDSSTPSQFHQSNSAPRSIRKMDNPTLRKGLDKITSSLNHIGDTFEKAFEEGRTIVENKTADIIQETRKLQIRRKGNTPELHNEVPGANGSSWQQPLMQPTQPQNQMNHETQLKASRDVAMATAAKAKLLLRELKTVKADLAFAKLRCSQLEEENKILRESCEKGDNPADDDLIRLQLETLLAEKARLAHENSLYARENRFLREIVEYHQLTMQDVVFLDEGNEEVTEVCPITRMLSITPSSPMSPPSPSEITASASQPETKEIFPVPYQPQERQGVSVSATPQHLDAPVLKDEDAKSKEEDAKNTSANKQVTCSTPVNKEENPKGI